jgi:hypothetical protein
MSLCMTSITRLHTNIRRALLLTVKIYQLPLYLAARTETQLTPRVPQMSVPFIKSHPLEPNRVAESPAMWFGTVALYAVSWFSSGYSCRWSDRMSQHSSVSKVTSYRQDDWGSLSGKDSTFLSSVTFRLAVDLLSTLSYRAPFPRTKSGRWEKLSTRAEIKMRGALPILHPHAFMA